MSAITLEQLKKFEGKRIDTICGSEYRNNADNHCAHFVSHALGLNFGFTCKHMTGKGDVGANIRVHELFSRCRTVGRWSDRPSHLHECLAFVISAKNVNLGIKQMTNVPKKHVGIFQSGSIWHYSNSGDKVVKQTPEQFARHYSGADIAVFFGEIPV